MSNAAQAIGLKSRQTITRWARLPTDESRAFALELETARERRDLLASQPMTPQRPSVALSTRSVVTLWDLNDYLGRLQDVASDDQHRACGTALKLLGAWHIDAPISAKRKIAERAALAEDSTGVVRHVELPAVDPEPDVIDAEVIE